MSLSSDTGSVLDSPRASETNPPEPCRDACIAEAEPLAGSAGSADTWIGLSWPKPRWHRSKVLQSPGLPAELAELESAAAERGLGLSLRLFQRTPASSIESIEMVLARGGQGFKLFDVPIAAAPGVALAFLRGQELGFESRPLGAELFVCTDGKHDRCCARVGRPLFKRLLQVRAESGLRVEISEVSHIGGHRFAANCLALPQGYLYGRVELDDAEELLRLTANGQSGHCLSHRWRGRLGTSELQQVVEGLALAHGFALDDLAIEELPATTSARTRVGLRVRGRGSFVVECERRSFLAPTSCESPEPIAEVRERWVALGLEPSS